MAMVYYLEDGTSVDCEEVARDSTLWDTEIMSRSRSFWWRYEVARRPALAYVMLFLADCEEGRYSHVTGTRTFTNSVAEGVFRRRVADASLSDLWVAIMEWVRHPAMLHTTRITGNALDVAASWRFSAWDTVDGPSLVRLLPSSESEQVREALAQSIRSFPERYVTDHRQLTLMQHGAVFATPWQRAQALTLSDVYGLSVCRSCRCTASDCECVADDPESHLGPVPTDLDELGSYAWGMDASHKKARITFPRSRATKDIPRFVGVEIEITACKDPGYFYDFAEATGAGLKGDGSLPFGDESFELILPPRKGASFDELLDELRGVFARTKTMITQHCGLHVHVDARRLVEADLRRVARAWYAKEGEFLAKHVAKKRRGNRYCREWARLLGSDVSPAVFDAVTYRDGYFRGLATSGDRYVTLNTCSLPEHKTLEVRAFSWDDFPHEVIGGFRTSFIDATNAHAAIAHIRSKASAAARFVHAAKSTQDPNMIEV